MFSSPVDITLILTANAAQWNSEWTQVVNNSAVVMCRTSCCESASYLGIWQLSWRMRGVNCLHSRPLSTHCSVFSASTRRRTPVFVLVMVQISNIDLKANWSSVSTTTIATGEHYGTSTVLVPNFWDPLASRLLENAQILVKKNSADQQTWCQESWRPSSISMKN